MTASIMKLIYIKGTAPLLILGAGVDILEIIGLLPIGNRSDANDERFEPIEISSYEVSICITKTFI